MGASTFQVPRAPERVGLMDLAVKRAIVTLSGGQQMEVKGLAVREVLGLMNAHVPLRKYLERAPLSYLEIAQTAPAAVPVAIALGCGYGGNKQAEEVAASLSLQDQVDILAGIGGCTFTRGFGPFAEALAALGVTLAEPAFAAGKGRPTRLRKMPPPSSALANLKRGSSRSRQGSSRPTSS